MTHQPDLLPDDDIELKFIIPLESYTYEDCCIMMAGVFELLAEEDPDWLESEGAQEWRDLLEEQNE